MFEKGQVRRFGLVIASIGFGLLAPLLLLEIVLRFLPVDRGLRSVPVDDSNPIHRFTPNRTSTFSRSWNFTQANIVRSNNCGFINNQDYESAATTPLLAIVGDSYVEAVMGGPRTAVTSGSSATANPARVADAKRAVDAFLRLLPDMAGLQSSDILLAVDGIRPAIYVSGDAAEESPYAHQMRQYFMTEAHARRFEVVDMHEEFRRHFREHGQRFEFERDAHWNAVGHEVFASAVKRSALYARLRIMLPSQEGR